MSEPSASPPQKSSDDETRSYVFAMLQELAILAGSCGEEEVAAVLSALVALRQKQAGRDATQH